MTNFFRSTPASETLNKIKQAGGRCVHQMYDSWKSNFDLFWNGNVSADDLVTELGTDATDFFVQSYTFAEIIYSLDPSKFPNGKSMGYLVDALPPRVITYNQDGSCTLGS